MENTTADSVDSSNTGSEIPEADIRKAKSAHEILIMNLIFGHLLAAPAIIVMDIGYIGLLIPVAISAILLSFYYMQRKSLSESRPWVAAHWQLAIKRFRILFISYAAVTALLLIISFLVSPESIAFVALSRVAVMPAVVTVFVVFVLSSSSLGRAGKGEAA